MAQQFVPLGGGRFRVHNETVDVTAHTCTCGQSPCYHAAVVRYVEINGELPPMMRTKFRYGSRSRQEARQVLARNVELTRGPEPEADAFFG